MMEIVQIPVLQDNYIYVLHEPTTRRTAVVDPAVHEPVLAVLKSRGWTLHCIFNTHHHGDHVGANLALKSETGCTIMGPANDAGRIPGMDIPLHDNDTVSLGNEIGKVLFVPGHTSGHIAYFFAGVPALFCGDTLFRVGCGRLFEGTPTQMWNSLRRIRALPPETQVYCAHEYTASNIRFAQSVLPQSKNLQATKEWVDVQRAQNLPTVPFALGPECAVNPFLRADEAEVQSALDMQGRQPSDVFAALRHRKDNFR